MSENSENTANQPETTQFKRSLSSDGDAQAMYVPENEEKNTEDTPVAIPTEFEVMEGSKMIRMIRSGKKLTEKQMAFMNLLNQHGSDGESIKSLLLKAGYTEARASQGIAAAGSNVKFLIEDNLDEREMLAQHKALQSRVRIEKHTFDRSYSDLDIFMTFKNYGKVILIKNIPYADYRNDPKTGEPMIMEREARVECIDNMTVANALDKSFKMKGKYIQKIEQNTTTTNLTDVLKMMIAERDKNVQQNVPKPR